MDEDSKNEFIELVSLFIILRRDKLALEKFKPYLFGFLGISVLVLFAKPGILTTIIYFALLLITCIMYTISKKEAEKEIEKEWEGLSKKLDNPGLTQTEFLYDLWKGNLS